MVLGSLNVSSSTISKAPVTYFFSEERTSSTHALTMYRYNYSLNGKTQKVDIWDTAGQESFNELHPTYYFGAHICILVFDANRKVTY